MPMLIQKKMSLLRMEVSIGMRNWTDKSPTLKFYLTGIGLAMNRMIDTGFAKNLVSTTVKGVAVTISI